MSDNNTTIHVQPVLDLQNLHKQLNSQKFKINVDIDTSALSSQVQDSISQFTANMQSTKIPIEADTSTLATTLDMISNAGSIIGYISNARNTISQSLD